MQRTANGVKQEGKQLNPSVARDSAYSSAAGHTLSNLDTFANVVNEWKHLVNYMRQQLEILTDLNLNLREEVVVLTHKEARARHSSHHDWLTGLPNRSLLQDRFHQAMADAKRRRKPLALLLLDLDNFKYVNDKHGHASGDKLLQAVALRLTKGIRGTDSACRYGGDEFVIILPVIDSPPIATALAAEIGRRLCEPYIVDGCHIDMSVSIGVAVYPGDGQTFDGLMKQADIAMYRAKQAGHGTLITEQTREATD
jgi:diguanylate cyclase (GGDEF)-like protein